MLSPWALIPMTVTAVCAVLIHFRRSAPNNLSNLGAGALLFAFLWISGSLSLDRLNINPANVKPNIALTPLFSIKDVYFSISATNQHAREFLYRISPDIEFHSTGFLTQIDAVTNLPSPRKTILSTQNQGIVDIDVKYIDQDNEESAVWSFSFDMDAERFKYEKQSLMNMKGPWVTVHRDWDLDSDVFPPEEKTFVSIDSSLLWTIKMAWKAVVYGINTDQPNIVLHREAIGSLNILSDKGDAIQFVTSYLILTDGSSTDVRKSVLEPQ